MNILLNNKQASNVSVKKLRPAMNNPNGKLFLSKKNKTKLNNNISNSNIPELSNEASVLNDIPQIKRNSGLGLANRSRKEYQYREKKVLLSESISKANTYFNTLNEKPSERSLPKLESNQVHHYQTHQINDEPIKKVIKININSNLNNSIDSNGVSPRDNQSTNSFFNNSKSTTFPKCIICGRIYPQNDILSTKNCKHGFCQCCLREYFEYKISNGETDINCFKCPVTGCMNFFDYNQVYENITHVYSNYISNNQSPIKYSIKDLSEYRKMQKKDLRKYSKHNVLDLSNNKDFYLYSKKKIEICPLCHQNNLFHKKGTKFYTCLNCLEKVCKYCRCTYSESHFKKDSNDRCKVFYKVGAEHRSSHIIKNHIFLLFLRALFYTIIGYLIFFFGICMYVIEGVDWLLCYSVKSKNVFFCICGILLKIILTSIGLLIAIPICLVLIPYFSILSSI